ncbi:MAG: phage-related tail protein, partial [Colwellia sp.]
MTDKDKITEKLSKKIVMLTQENKRIKDEHKKLTEYLSADLDRTGLFI